MSAALRRPGRVAALGCIFGVVLLLTLAATAGAFTASATAPTDLTATAAVLQGQGTCDANSACNAYFRYQALTASSWHTTAVVTVSNCGTGTGCPWALGQKATGLAPSTTYQYQLCSEDHAAAYACYGPDGTTSTFETYTTPASGGSINGASTAYCNPSPCMSGTSTSYTLTNVSDDDGTSSTRVYDVYRPSGLAASSVNRPPAILVFYSSGNCGYSPVGRWHALAAEGRFIVVDLEVPCNRTWDTNNWGKRWVNGYPGPTTPDDEPYARAVVNAVETCPGQCTDPKRIYAVGESSGGNMVADLMCDSANSALFRGYEIDSSSLQLFNGSPNCPSTNRNYFVMLALSNYSADQAVYYDTAPNPHLDVSQTGTHFQDWAAQRLGCTGGEMVDGLGTTSTTNTGPGAAAMTQRYRYFAPCAYATGGAAVEALGVLNGGHGWQCQDSAPATFYCPGMPNPPGLDPGGAPWTDGLYVEQEFLNFVNGGISPP